MKKLFFKRRPKHDANTFIEITNANHLHIKNEKYLLCDNFNNNYFTKALLIDVLDIKRHQLTNFYTQLNNDCDVDMHNKIDSLTNEIKHNDSLQILLFTTIYTIPNEKLD